MRVVVFGATGGSGRAAVRHLLEARHEVTVFTRGEQPYEVPRGAVRTVRGDVRDAAAVEAAVRGQQAVIVTLGITENALSVLLFGPARTSMDVRSVGTRNIIAAMKRERVGRLVVQTSYGTGPTRARLGRLDRLFIWLLLHPQFMDMDVQDAAVRASNLTWTLVQPVNLTDAAEDRLPELSASGDVVARHVSRQSVGRFLAHALESDAFVRQTVALSGAQRQALAARVDAAQRVEA